MNSRTGSKRLTAGMSLEQVRRGRLKMQDRKMTDRKMTDKSAGLENAGLENDGQKCNTQNALIDH